MKVFVTGASGFIGSAVVKELVNAGHQVTGLARSEEAIQAIIEAGAQGLRGSLEDSDSLRRGVSQADAVIHTAFIHDFSQYAKASEVDRVAIMAMGEVLRGTFKPIVVTAGSLGLPKINGFVTEASVNERGARASEAAALGLAQQGINASVVRLPPSVHDKGDQGFVPFLIAQALKNGVSAYPEEGLNHWPAVHRLDAARLFRLAIEKPRKGALYNAIGETGIKVKDIAGLIAQKLNLTSVTVSNENLASHFEWMSGFISFDSPATSFQTQHQLGWHPVGPGLLQDMETYYF